MLRVDSYASWPRAEARWAWRYVGQRVQFIGKLTLEISGYLGHGNVNTVYTCIVHLKMAMRADFRIVTTGLEACGVININ